MMKKVKEHNVLAILKDYLKLDGMSVGYVKIQLFIFSVFVFDIKKYMKKHLNDKKNNIQHAKNIFIYLNKMFRHWEIKKIIRRYTCIFIV